MIELLIYIFSGLYLLIVILIHIGLSRKSKYVSDLPTVSVLIAAKNEEKNLPDCLTSIENLEYPKEKLEILVINDRSNDGTEVIANDFCKKNPCFNFLNISEDKYGLFAKMNALAQGIEKTAGEIIFVTDADCIVPEHWLKALVKYFGYDIGMCGGLTVLSQNVSKEKMYDKLQALDWMFLQAVASGSCNLGLPVSILGNNFAFRRKAYEDVGGFRKLRNSVTEDMALLQSIHKSKKWKIVYPLNVKTQIFSKPVRSIAEFYKQRKRWVIGGRSTNWWGYFISYVSLLTHLLIFFLIILGFWKKGIVLITFTLICDASIYIIILNRIKRIDLLGMSLVFKLYYVLYTFIFSIVHLFGKKVDWKDKSLKI